MRISDWSSDVCSSDLHSLHEVNDGLAHGRVFFMEVKKDGIALYEADERELATPKPKMPNEALAMETEYFEEWYSTAGQFHGSAKHSISQGWLKKAAFDLHQATERLYSCLLLTITIYAPYKHNFHFLGSLPNGLVRPLYRLLPERTPTEPH